MLLLRVMLVFSASRPEMMKAMLHLKAMPVYSTWLIQQVYQVLIYSWDNRGNAHQQELLFHWWSLEKHPWVSSAEAPMTAYCRSPNGVLWRSAEDHPVLLKTSCFTEDPLFYWTFPNDLLKISWWSTEDLWIIYCSTEHSLMTYWRPPGGLLKISWYSTVLLNIP